jgi:hypothetical protein
VWGRLHTKILLICWSQSACNNSDGGSPVHATIAVLTDGVVGYSMQQLKFLWGLTFSCNFLLGLKQTEWSEVSRVTSSTSDTLMALNGKSPFCAWGTWAALPSVKMCLVYLSYSCISRHNTFKIYADICTYITPWKILFSEPTVYQTLGDPTQSCYPGENTLSANDTKPTSMYPSSETCVTASTIRSGVACHISEAVLNRPAKNSDLYPHLDLA